MLTSTFMIFAEVLAWWCGIGLLAALLAVVLGVALGEYRLVPPEKDDQAEPETGLPEHAAG